MFMCWRLHLLPWCRRICKTVKSVVLYACSSFSLSAWNNSAHIAWIFMKFWIWLLVKNFKKLPVSLKSEKDNGTLYEYLFMGYLALGICDTYCFCMATVATRMCLNVLFIHTLPVLCNTVLNITCLLPYFVFMYGHLAHMGEERGVYRFLVGKPEGKTQLGRPRCRWVDNIRMDLQEVGCGYMDWIGLAQDRDRWRTLVSTVMNRRVPWNAGNFLTSCKPVSFSRRTLLHGVSIA